MLKIEIVYHRITGSISVMSLFIVKYTAGRGGAGPGVTRLFVVTQTQAPLKFIKED